MRTKSPAQKATVSCCFTPLDTLTDHSFDFDSGASVAGVNKTRAVSKLAWLSRATWVFGVAGVLLAGSVPSAGAQTSVKLLSNINGYAGNGTVGETTTNPASNQQALSVELNTPSGLAFDGQGNAYITDYFGAQVHKVDSQGRISVVAGTGVTCTAASNGTTNGVAETTNPCGDNGPAVSAQLNHPYAIAVDRAGNLFICDQSDNRIRRVDATTQMITTVVGNGSLSANAYKSATPISATGMGFTDLDGLAVDSNDNLYISDSGDSLVYRYNAATQLINVYLSAASSSPISQAIGLTVDTSNNLYVANQVKNNVLKVVPGAAPGNTPGAITVVAGNGTAGYSGDHGPALQAEFNAPRSVAVDAAGDLLISDSQNLVVRIVYAIGGTVTANSVIETIAGTGANCTGGTLPCGDGSLAIDASFYNNGGLTGGSTQFGYDIPRGTFYIADLGDNRVRSLTPSTFFAKTQVGSTTTQRLGIQLVGGATTISSISIAPGIGGAQEFTVGAITSQPVSINPTTNAPYETGATTLTCSISTTTSNAAGTICNVSVAFKPAYPGNRTAQLKIVTGAGTFYFGVNGLGISPEVALNSAQISTYAGTGTAGNTTNATATTSQISGPRHSVVDGQGNLYFVDTLNNIVREVTPAGIISTVAGGATAVCTAATDTIGDGCPATSATLNAPQGVSVDATGNLYIADTGNNRIRLVTIGTPNSIITTLAGTGAAGFSGDQGLATSAQLNAPASVFVDSTGNLFIADTGNNRIRTISSASIYISTYAGNGTKCASSTAACGDGTAAADTATAANLNAPQGVAIDPNGNLVIADTGDNRIRLVAAATDLISTVVGTGAATYVDNVAATTGTLNGPTDIAIDAAGDYYIADSGNNAIRQVEFATQTISTLAGTGTACALPTCGDGGSANTALLSAPSGVSLDAKGDIYISDYNDNEIRQVNVDPATLTFPNTGIGNTSAPQNANFQNIGNELLTLPTPANGTNPSVSTGFLVGNTGSCSPLGTTTPASSIAMGTQCSYSVSFSPQQLGTFSGRLVETDNSLNAPTATPVTQFFTLTGNAVQDNPSVSLTTSPNPSTFGQSVMLSSTVTGNGTTPTGTVTFYQMNGTQVVNLSATVTTNTSAQTLTLPAGTYEITLPGTAGTGQFSGGLYNGWNPAQNPTTNDRWTDRYAIQLCATCATNQLFDTQGTGGNEPGFASDTAALAGYQTAPQLGISTNGLQPATSTVGNPYIFTLTATQAVTLSVPDPGSFGDDSGGLSLAVTTLTAIGTGSLNGAGLATTTTSTLPVGSDPIVAVYNGDTNNVDAISPVVTQVVNKAGGANTDALTVSPNPSTVGATVTLTDSIPEVNGVCPTGAVTFVNDSGTVLATGGTPAPPSPATTPATCVSTAMTTALPLGTTNITADLATDTNYLASTSNTVAANVTSAGLTASPATGDTYGTLVTLTDTIAPINNACPSVAATFTDTPAGGTLVTLGTGTFTLTNGSCIATYSTTTLPVGTDSLTATTTASAPFPATSAPLSYVVAKGGGANTDTLTVSPNPSTLGATVTLTDSIPELNGVCPTGAVTFVNGSGTVLATGSTLAAPSPATIPATCVSTATTTALPLGTTNITADLATDTNYLASTSNTVADTITQDNPSVSLTTSPNPSTFGQSVMLSSTVTGNGTTPTGTVTFYQMNGTQVVNLSATVTTNTSAQTLTLPAGTYEITLPGTAGTGQFSGGLYNGWNPAQNPTTNDRWTDRYAIQLCATCATNQLFDTQGTGGNEPGFASDTAALAGYQTAPQLGISTNGLQPATSTVGNPYIFTLTATQAVTLSVPDPGSFGDDSGGLSLAVTTLTAIGTGSLNGAGLATTTTSTLPVGSDPIVAVYNGDTNNVDAISPVVTQVVNKAGGANTDALTVSPNPSTVGATVTLTDSIPEVNGVCPTGAVTFVNDSGTVLATGGTPAPPSPATTPATCVSTAMTTALPLGTTNITADLATDTNYLASTSNTVAANVTSAGLTASPATGDTYGTLVTLTDTIAPINNACPSVAATFTDTPAGGTLVTLGTGTFTLTNGSCIATYSTTTLPVGTDSLTATTTASAPFPATSAPLSYVVAKAPETNTVTPTLSDSITGTPTPTTVGATVTVTFSIPVPTGDTAPTGTVTFSSPGATFTGPASFVAGPTVNGIPTYIATATTTTLPSGSDVVTGTYTGDTNYAGGPLTTTVVVSSAILTSNAPTPDTYGTPVTLTDTVTPINGACPTAATFSDGTTILGTGTFTLTNGSCIATYGPTTTLPVGINNLTATTQAGNGFPATDAPLTLTIGPSPETNTVTPALSDGMTATPTPTTVGATVTATFSIPVPTGDTPPTGTVTFSSPGATFTGPASFVAGPTVNGVPTYIATATTTTLPAGTDLVTGNYTGDTNYAGGPLTATVVVNSVVQNDFSIAATPPTQTINPGDTVVYTVSLSGVGSPFTSPVTLTATGLPPGATVTFGTQTYVPGAGPTPTSMTIVTSPLQAQATPTGGRSNIYYGLLLLPLLGIRRLRRKMRSLPKGIVYGLAALAMLGGLGAITGCGGGYFGAAPASYTITVTGTSGTLVHSTTVTLTVR